MSVSCLNIADPIEQKTVISVCCLTRLSSGGVSLKPRAGRKWPPTRALQTLNCEAGRSMSYIACWLRLSPNERRLNGFRCSAPPISPIRRSLLPKIYSMMNTCRRSDIFSAKSILRKAKCEPLEFQCDSRALPATFVGLRRCWTNIGKRFCWKRMKRDDEIHENNEINEI